MSEIHPESLLAGHEGSAKAIPEVAGLCFRVAQAEADIVALAQTELYGDRRTDLSQVLDWWRAYPHGNLLAVYEDRIVGGMDIWPVQAVFYEGFVSQRLSESDLGPEAFNLHLQQGAPSHWYVGSISLQRILPARQQRRAMLHLITSGIAHWATLVPGAPAYIAAESWTDAGRNLLRRFGWEPRAVRRTQHSEDTIFEYRLSSWAQYQRQREQLLTRFGA